MKRLQKIISMLLLALALGSQDATQASIYELLGKPIDDYLCIPTEIGFRIGSYGTISPLLSYECKQVLDASNKSFWNRLPVGFQIKKNLEKVEMKFSQDGNAFTLRLTDGIWELWVKQPNGQFARLNIQNPDLDICGIEVSPDGNVVAIYLSDNTCQLWTKQSDGQFAFSQNLNVSDQNLKIRALKFSHDGNIVALKLTGGICELWTKQEEGQFAIFQVLKIANKNLKICDLKFNRDGSAVALSISNTTYALLIKQPDGRFTQQNPSDQNLQILIIGFSSDGNIIDIKRTDDTHELWIKQPDGQFTRLNIQNQHLQIIDTQFFEGNTIGLRLSDNTWEVWTKLPNGQFAQLHIQDQSLDIRDVQLTDGNVVSLYLSDGTYELWIKQPDGQFTFVQVLSLIQELGPRSRIRRIQLSPDGNSVAITVNEFFWMLWIKQPNGKFAYHPLNTHSPNAKIHWIYFKLAGNAICLQLDENNRNSPFTSTTYEFWSRQQDGQFAYQSPHTPNVQIKYIHFSSDRKTIVFKLTNGICEIWTKQQSGQFVFSQFLTPHTPNAQIRHIHLSPDGNTIVFELTNNTWEFWEKGTERLREGAAGLEQQLFIRLLADMKKKNLPTSLALIAHYCRKQGLNITLKELEDIFYSFGEAEQLYLEKLFDINEPKLYRELEKLDPDLAEDEEKRELVQLLREYKIFLASIQSQKVSLKDLTDYYLKKRIALNKPMNVYQSLYPLSAFNSFSEEAQKFLQDRYQLNASYTSSSCVIS